MWPNPQETADLVTITEETLNEKLHFLCSDHPWNFDLTFSKIINIHQRVFHDFFKFAPDWNLTIMILISYFTRYRAFIDYSTVLIIFENSFKQLWMLVNKILS